MSTIHPLLARFAADLNDVWANLCGEAPGEFFDLFNPVQIRLYTGDGLTAKFYDDGIEFYPKRGSDDEV